MASLASAVKKTLRYAAFFDFPLTLTELHHWLISPKPVSLSRLRPFTHLTQKLSQRRRPARYSKHKLDRANQLAGLLRFLPTIRLVAVTGSLSVDNAQPGDDIDLMIVTSPQALWLTRPLVLVFSSLFGRVRRHHMQQTSNAFCFNLWLDTTALAVPHPKRNLYTAHEVLQVKPLLNRDYSYENFIAANSWTQKHLANAYLQTSHPTSFRAHPVSFRAQSRNPFQERFLVIPNYLAFFFQYLYMKPKITREYITPHAAYFHPRDLSPQIRARIEA